MLSAHALLRLLFDNSDGVETPVRSTPKRVPDVPEELKPDLAIDGGEWRESRTEAFWSAHRHFW